MIQFFETQTLVCFQKNIFALPTWLGPLGAKGLSGVVFPASKISNIKYTIATAPINSKLRLTCFLRNIILTVWVASWTPEGSAVLERRLPILVDFGGEREVG